MRGCSPVLSSTCCPTAAHSPHRSLPVPCSSPSCVPGMLCDTTPYATVRSPGPGHHPQNWPGQGSTLVSEQGLTTLMLPLHSPQAELSLWAVAERTAGLWPGPGDSGDGSMLCSGLCPGLHHLHKGQGWAGLAAGPQAPGEAECVQRRPSVSRGG